MFRVFSAKNPAVCKQMPVKALVELRDAIISARDSDHLRRFPGRFHVYKAVFHARGYRRSREPVFAQTAWIIYRAQNKSSASYRRHSLYVGSAFPSVRLAERSHHRQTRHVDSLAPHSVPAENAIGLYSVELVREGSLV